MKTRHQRGLSLIELLVALSIGSFLVIGAVTLQSQTRRSFTVNEQQARLQETARYVMSVLEPEVQLAGIFGFSNNPNAVKMVIDDVDYYAADMRQSKTALPDMPSSFDDCGNNFVVDVTATVQAFENTYGLPAGCAAQGGGHNGTSDTLVIRRTGLVDEAASGDRLQLYTNRLVPMDQRLFIGDDAPGVLEDEMKEVRDVIVQIYYIAQDADNHPGVPALRIKQLVPGAGGPEWDDREIIRGVEDMQVEFGVDPGADSDDADTLPDDVMGDGMADLVNGDALRYVPPGDALLSSGQVVSVRIWLRVRAEEPEVGFQDDRVYTYGSTEDFTPADGFRRVLTTRTIYLRNSRAFEN
jgi:type IV pilus assembly protein PilW